MYRNHFGLRERPFSIAPDPYYLYMSEQHREALAHLLYGVDQSGGFILLSGEVGTGKTTICRSLLEQMPEDTEFAFIMNTKVSTAELLETICQEFAIPLPQTGLSAKHLSDLLNDYLIEIHGRGRRAVLIIDEAQNLDMEVLEQIRLLTNLETTSAKLLQIILLGQPELRQKLAQPELRQLSQRITARYHLSPLTAPEVVAYIQHRLKIAGASRQIFTEQALERVFTCSQGVPRLINLICDRALLGAYSANINLIDGGVITRAAAEVLGEKSPEQAGTARSWQRPTAVVAVVLLLGGAGLFLGKKASPPVPAPAAKVENKTAQEKSTAITASPTPQPALPVAPLTPSPTENQPTTAAVAPPSIPATVPAVQEPATRPDGGSAAGARDGAGAAAPPPALPASSPAVSPLPFEQPAWRQESLAYEAYFSLWSLPYDSGSQPCRQAEKNGLRCYGGNGSFDEIRRLGLPVYLRLDSQEGKEKASIHAIVTGIGVERATLRSGGESITVSLRELIHRWSGQYILLWRPPAGYRDSVRPGQSGEIVAWIDRSLGKTEKAPADRPAKTVYDDELVSRVKEFQFRKGLTSDGIAGILTLIHLSAAADESVPRLTKEQ